MSSTHVKVTVHRHSGIYMPGDVLVLPLALATELKAKGVVDFEGKTEAPAPVLKTGAAEFDPAKSPMDEVRAFIVGRGVTIVDGTADALLRKQAAAILAKSATE